ncbi:MAG: Septum formation [Actinomycetia bacterium]|nr:Septum formation [Actinomycetes bacterium]
MLRAAFALTALLLVVGCGTEGAGDVPRDASGRVTAGGIVRADKLQPGDCFQDQDDRTPDGFPVVPCGRAHANEAYDRFVVPGGAYPGQAALTDIATARCRADPFTTYVGRPIDGSALDVFFVLPSADTWTNDGDRIIVCALYADDRSPLVGSMNDSMR